MTEFKVGMHFFPVHIFACDDQITFFISLISIYLFVDMLLQLSNQRIRVSQKGFLDMIEEMNVCKSR